MVRLVQLIKRIGLSILGGIMILTMLVTGGQSGLVSGQDDDRKIVNRTCLAELNWMIDQINLRRGPSVNYATARGVPQGTELRILGINEEGDWVQAFLGEPFNRVGWTLRENLNLFGACMNLPVTTDDLEPESPDNPPPLIEFPAFAEDIELTDGDRVFQLNEGMLYIRHETVDPHFMQAHIVIADLSHPNLQVQTNMVATPFVRNGLISEKAREIGAYVAINGDFYLSDFMPQGLMLIDGDIVTAPKHRATFAITEDNEPFIGYFTEDWTWDGSVVAENGAWIPLQLANIACDNAWICLFTDFWSQLPFANGYDGVHVLLNPDYEVVDITVNQIVEIPEEHLVLRSGDSSEAGRWLQNNLEIGDTVEINTTTEPDWRDYDYAISGGPMIVQGGRFVQDCDPDVAEEERQCEDLSPEFRQSHYFSSSIPRSAIGYDSENNSLILIMVEGQSIRGGSGIRQRDLAELFIDLGADTAMEFDGGGSASMWMASGNVNDFPETGERHVVNMLSLFWDEP